MIVILGGIDDGRGQVASGSLLLDGIGNEAGHRRLASLVEIDARQGGGDFRSLGQRVRQRPRVRRHRGLKISTPAHFLDHDAGARGHIDAETALGTANGSHNLRHDFGDDQPPELAGAERFVEKQAALDGPEAESDEGSWEPSVIGRLLGRQQLPEFNVFELLL